MKTAKKTKKKPAGLRTAYDKFDKGEIEDEERTNHNSTANLKSMNKSSTEAPKEMNTNTVTTFSRMEEEPEQRNNDFNDMYGAPPEDGRVPCPNCGRKFNPDRLPVHQKSCNNKKRSVFNSQKKRAVEGTMGFQSKNKKKTPKKKSKKNDLPGGKKAKWKRDHEDLVKAIKMSRMIKKVQEEGGDVSKIPVAPPSQNDDYVECQY